MKGGAITTKREKRDAIDKTYSKIELREVLLANDLLSSNSILLFVHPPSLVYLTLFLCTLPLLCFFSLLFPLPLPSQ